MRVLPRHLIIALVAVVLAGLVGPLAPSPAAAARKSVATKAEYKKIKEGWTLKRVRKTIGAKGKKLQVIWECDPDVSGEEPILCASMTTYEFKTTKKRRYVYVLMSDGRVYYKDWRKRVDYTYSSCAALRRDFPSGVGRKGAVDQTDGTPVKNYYQVDWLYKLNNGPRSKKTGEHDLDGDNDGIACEPKR